LLADLVGEGFIRGIPNDPWTSRRVVNTGAEEDADWFYINDGQTLTLYAYSHPGRKYILPSFGKAPLSSPVVATPEKAEPEKSNDEDKKDKSSEHAKKGSD
jgi:hypothetical protein